MHSYKANFHEVLSPATIDLRMKACSKSDAIRQLVALLAADKRILDREVFIDEVLKREALETTNMGKGVAIPHGKTAAVARNSIAIGRLEQPIEWSREQEAETVSVVFLLAVRDDAQRDRAHLELISKVAALLIKEDFRNTLFKTEDKRELIEKIYTLVGEE
jgi:PTS system fructose-specific IIA component